MQVLVSLQTRRVPKVKAVIIGFIYEHGQVRYRAKTQFGTLTDALCSFEQLAVGDAVLGEYCGSYIDVIDVLHKDTSEVI